MTAAGVRDPEFLVRVRDQIESFLASLKEPVALENGVELIHLAAAEWRLSIEYGKLIFEAWNSSRSISRRIEQLINCEPGRMSVLARKARVLDSTRLEFQERGLVHRATGEQRPSPDERSRKQFRQELLSMLGREFSACRFENVSNRSHREHSFSAWYTRGLARRGSTWAFLGLSELETMAAADAVLAFGLIWLDWLRGRPATRGPISVTGIKLFLPRSAVEITAHRAAYLNPRAVDVEILEWNAGEGRPEPVDLKDYGNVATRLSACRDRAALLERHVEVLHKLLAPLGTLYRAEDPGPDPKIRGWQGFSLSSNWSGTSTAHGASERRRGRQQRPLGHVADASGGLAPESSAGLSVDVIPDPGGSFLSLRVCGLEVARIEGGITPRVYFGIEGNLSRLQEDDPTEFYEFLNYVIDARHAHAKDPTHELYRLQSERWLESLLVRDLTRIDPAFLADFVYPQVPAFAGVAQSDEAISSGASANHGFSDGIPFTRPALARARSRMTRGVIDILSVTRPSGSGAGHRLAVVELKVHEEINLPLQGLDYWLRVKWLQERDQFKKSGYFRGIELSAAPPLLYFVCPAFRFHSTTKKLIRYLNPAVEVILVGINQTWRRGVKVLFRRELRSPLSG